MPENEPTAPVDADADLTAAPSWPRSEAARRESIVRTTVESTVFRLVREFDGPDAIQPPPADADSWHRNAEPEPRAAIRVALDLHAAARTVLTDHIGRARGVGHCWTDLAPVLGVEKSATELDLTAAEAAFNVAATGQTTGWVSDDRRWSRGFVPTLRWTCESCRQRVTDHGPVDSYPGEMERGHAADCARHAAALTAWNTAMDACDTDDEEPGTEGDDR
jgi:hypothetical protein